MTNVKAWLDAVTEGRVKKGGITNKMPKTAKKKITEMITTTARKYLASRCALDERKYDELMKANPQV